MERFHPVVFLLPGNVFPHCLPRSGTHGESRVATLSCKFPAAFHMLMHPCGGSLLQFPYEIRKAMGGFQSHQQMHMIRHAADGFGNATQAMDRATKIFMKPWTPRGIDQRYPVLRAENNVIMQAQIGGGHDGRVGGATAGVTPLSGTPSGCGMFLGAWSRGVRRCAPRPRANVCDPFGIVRCRDRRASTSKRCQTLARRRMTPGLCDEITSDPGMGRRRHVIPGCSRFNAKTRRCFPA